MLHFSHFSRSHWDWLAWYHRLSVCDAVNCG